MAKANSDPRPELERILVAAVMEHLAKLAEYVPGPVRKSGSSRELLATYRQDPVFGIFGLDSSEYLGATLAGGTVTSIHRRLGDIFETCVRMIFMHMLNQTSAEVTLEAVIRNGDETETRRADAYLRFDRLDDESRERVAEFGRGEVAKLAPNADFRLVGIGFEVRHCYRTGDSKRTQADEAMARHLLLNGILPVMPLFCNQSNPAVVRRYRSVWVVKQGPEAFETVRICSGFDFHDFLRRHRERFRQPVISMLRRLTG